MHVLLDEDTPCIDRSRRNLCTSRNVPSKSIVQFSRTRPQKPRRPRFPFFFLTMSRNRPGSHHVFGGLTSTTLSYRQQITTRLSPAANPAISGNRRHQPIQRICAAVTASEAGSIRSTKPRQDPFSTFGTAEIRRLISKITLQSQLLASVATVFRRRRPQRWAVYRGGRFCCQRP